MNAELAEAPVEPLNNPAVPATPAGPGAQLGAQRIALGWTVEQIADQLKLAPRQVIALEAGDYEALPTMAVVRGFVRAYAKVLKMDATPLVAMIEVHSPTSPEVTPVRREIAASFSESRFPSMTERSSMPAGWMIAGGVAAVVIAAVAYAYQSGMISPGLFSHADSAAVSASASVDKPAEVAPLETTLVKSGVDSDSAHATGVPLVSAPAAPAEAPAPVAAAPAVAAATAPAAPAAAPVAAAQAGNQLVLKVVQDSWVEIRRPGGAPLISRVVKGGSTETFDIKEASLLIVGKPGHVEATLAGAPLALPAVDGGTISRVHIK